MATQFKVGIDWDRKGMICWDAQTGDALNIFPEPLRYIHLDWRTSLADSVALIMEKTLYGVRLFNVCTGTGANNGLVLGQDNSSVVDDIAVSASTTYSVSVRVKGISDYAGVPFRLKVRVVPSMLTMLPAKS